MKWGIPVHGAMPHAHPPFTTVENVHQRIIGGDRDGHIRGGSTQRANPGQANTKSESPHWACTWAIEEGAARAPARDWAAEEKINITAYQIPGLGRISADSRHSKIDN